MPITPQAIVSTTQDGASHLKLAGSWRIKHVDEITNALSDVDLTDSSNLTVDGKDVGIIDTAGAMELYHCLNDAGFVGPNKEIHFENFSDDDLTILKLVKDRLGNPAEVGPAPHDNILETLGKATVRVAHRAYEILSFVGYSFKELVNVIKKPSLFGTKEFFVQLENCFVDAIPVVILVNFLIGIVLAYLFAVHAEQFGANIFVVDSVAFAMCREFAPIIVAVVVESRSGSAFAAQIGTMKLNEEVDALQTLGLSPMHVLVLPRVLALMVAMPLLVFIGDVVGIIGGLLIADLRLGITSVTFIERLQIVLTTNSFMVGLIKAPVFAAFIALIGCRMGLTVENNARSVGLNTTSTVVQSIVSVILLNAAFAVIFTEMGI